MTKTCGLPFSRTRSEPYPLLNGTLTRQYGTGTPVILSNVVRSKSMTMTDVVTPCWRSKIRQGITVHNNCVLTLNEYYTEGQGEAEYTTSTRKRWYDGNCATYFKSFGAPSRLPSITNPYPYVDYTAARFNALKEIDNTPYEMIEDIGELRETAAFLMDPLNSMKQLSIEFDRESTKLMHKHRIGRHKAIAKAWLSYRFAFLPLLQTVFNLFEAAHEYYIPPPPIRTARGFSSKTTSYEDTKSGVWSTFERKSEQINDVHAYVAYTVTNPASAWRTRFGLRNKDIPKGIWQLIPFSFLIDRLVDISGAVSGFVNLADPELRIEMAGTVLKFDDKVTHRFTALSLPLAQVTPDAIVYHNFYYIRSNWGVTYSDAIPPVDIGGLTSSLTRVADLVALIIATLFHRK